MGLEHGGITVEQIGELETKHATRSRIKWGTGLALFNELGAATLSGIIASTFPIAALDEEVDTKNEVELSRLIDTHSVRQ